MTGVPTHIPDSFVRNIAKLSSQLTPACTKTRIVTNGTSSSGVAKSPHRHTTPTFGYPSQPACPLNAIVFTSVLQQLDYLELPEDSEEHLRHGCQWMIKQTLSVILQRRRLERRSQHLCREIADFLTDHWLSFVRGVQNGVICFDQYNVYKLLLLSEL